MISDSTIRWLLESNPVTNYMTRVDILEEKFTLEEKNKSISEILAYKKVSDLIEDLDQHFPYIATRHTDAKLSHYKLRMLSDFGLKKQDGLQEIINNFKNKQDNGLFAIRQLLPIKEVDKSKEWNALPCDSPQILYTLKTLGENDELISKQIEYLIDAWKTPIGWFCNLPFVKSQFKKEQIGCPMAGLFALEVFSLDDNLKESISAQNAFQTIIYHYELGKSLYYFGRGKKFYTFKYPYIWYNALYMADVLSKFEFTKNHELYRDLVEWIKKGQGEDYKYRPNSIYLEYKDWDFSNKKEYSPWITLLCNRILKRSEKF